MPHADPQQAKAYFRKYHLKNGDKRRTKMRANYQRNKEQYKARAKKWAQENPATRAYYAYLRHKAWREKNRGRHNAKQGKRVASKLFATPAWLTTAQLADIERWYSKAVAAGMTVDHIVPLQGKNVCGLHVSWNMQLLTHSENAAKGNRLEWQGG